MFDNPLPKLNRMAHQLNPTVVSTTLNTALVFEDRHFEQLGPVNELKLSAKHVLKFSNHG